MAENHFPGPENDYWRIAVKALTGYQMEENGKLFEKLTGNADIPLMRVEIDDHKGEPGEDITSAVDDLAWMGRNSGWRIQDTDFFIPFYSGDKGPIGDAGIGTKVRMKKARITLLGTQDHQVPAGGVVAGGEFSSNLTEDGKHFKKSDTPTVWSNEKLAQYSYGGGLALRSLLENDKTTGFAWNNVVVSKEDSVDLNSFLLSAEAFDRVAYFFQHRAGELSDWEFDLGKEEASWKGQAAGVFRDLIHAVNRNYKSYSEQFPIGKHSQDLRNFRLAVRNATEALHQDWDFWQLYMGNPLRWLYDILVDVANTVWYHNIVKVRFDTKNKRNIVQFSGFYGGDPDFGQLEDLQTWKKIGEKAIAKWRQSVQDILIPAGTAALIQVQNSFNDQKFPKSVQTNPFNISQEYAKDQAEKDKSDAEKNAKEAKDANDEALRWQKEQAEKQEKEAAKLRKEQEEKERKQKEEAEKLQKEQEEKQEKRQQEQDRKQEELQRKQDQKQEELQHKQDQKQQEQEQKQEELQRKQDQKQQEQEQKQGQLQQEQEKKQEELQRKQDQKQQEQEQKQEQLQKEQEKKQEEQQHKQEQRQEKLQQEQEQRQMLPTQLRVDRDQQKGEQNRKQQEQEQKQQELQHQQEQKQQEQEQKQEKVRREQEQKQQELQHQQEQKQQEQEQKQEKVRREQEQKQQELQQKQDQKQQEQEKVRREQEQKQQELQQKQEKVSREQVERRARTEAEYQARQEEQQRKAEQRQAEAEAIQEQRRKEAQAAFDKANQVREHQGQGYGNDPRLSGDHGLPGLHGGTSGSPTTTLNPDGSVTVGYPDGSTSTIDVPSGEVVTTHPDGSTESGDLRPGESISNGDGSTTVLRPDGKLSTTFPDGSTSVFDPDRGTITTHRPDGTSFTTPIQHGQTLPTGPGGPYGGSQYSPSFQQSHYGDELYDRIPASGSGAGPGSGVGGMQGSPPMMPLGQRFGGAPGGAGGGGEGERVRGSFDDGQPVTRRMSQGGRGGYDSEESVTTAGRGNVATSSGTPFLPPMGGAGGPGGGQQQTESGRPRTSWIDEDEDVWGTDEGGAPAVIGR